MVEIVDRLDDEDYRLRLSKQMEDMIGNTYKVNTINNQFYYINGWLFLKEHLRKIK
jgi:hypothetical protein